MADTFRNEMLKVLGRLKNNLEQEQQRGATSRNVVFREYANGQVLFRGTQARDAMAHYGPGGRVDVALKRAIGELRGLCDPQTTGLTIGITIDETEHQYLFVFIYAQS